MKKINIKKEIGVLSLVFMVTLGVLGVGYAAWTQSLTASATAAVSTLSVTTNAASDITATGATLNGYLNGLGGYSPVAVSFDYTTDNITYTNISAGSLGSTGVFSANPTLASDTTYYYRAKAVGYFTKYGTTQSFHTSAAPGQKTIYPIIDSYIYEGSSGNDNYGSNTNLDERGTGSSERRMLLQFDLGIIPAGKTIDTASLNIYRYHYESGGSSTTIGVYKLRRAWTESGVTWQYPWTTGGANSTTYDRYAVATTTSAVSGLGWKNWNVTADVMGFYGGTLTNYGWILWGSTDHTSNFYSRNYAAPGYSPFLIVNYH